MADQRFEGNGPQAEENMSAVLFNIETFLLPSLDGRYASSNTRKQENFSSSPLMRLDQILDQVALADHIRTMQIMYRDSEDELNLAGELRASQGAHDAPVKRLPTKHLMEKLSEGRARVVALCRLCHGTPRVK
jgi:hypothetical protein